MGRNEREGGCLYKNRKLPKIQFSLVFVCVFIFLFVGFFFFFDVLKWRGDYHTERERERVGRAISASRIVYSDVRSGEESTPGPELSFPPVCVWMIRYAHDFACESGEDKGKETFRTNESGWDMIYTAIIHWVRQTKTKFIPLWKPNSLVSSGSKS